MSSMRIGLLGGISPESTAEYYKRLCAKHMERHDNYHFPEIAIFSLDFQHYTDFENTNDMKGRLDYMLEGIKHLETCDVVAMTANSAHSLQHEVEDYIRKSSGADFISIAQATIRVAEEKGLDSLLLTGIKHTMRSNFYHVAARRYGIEIVVPNEDDQEVINNAIFGELCKGIYHDSTRQRLVEVIDSYNADGAILGCTELPLILKNGDCNKYLLDTVDIHVKAIMDYVEKHSQLPGCWLA